MTAAGLSSRYAGSGLRSGFWVTVRQISKGGTYLFILACDYTLQGSRFVRYPSFHRMKTAMTAPPIRRV